MPQEDRIFSTGREAIESLRDDYRDFCDDPDESFEEFAGDVFDIFNAAPDAVFSYDPQIRLGSIQRLPEPSREELLGLCSLASTQLMNRARNCANPHDMVRYARAAEWLEDDADNVKCIPFLTVEQKNRITIELAKNNRTGAAEVLEDVALSDSASTLTPLKPDREPEQVPAAGRPEVFCTIQWMRDDIVRAIEDTCDPLHDVELDRGGPQAEQVESLIDQVIGEIGKHLQDRSIEEGWGVIDNFIPDKVTQRAEALAARQESRATLNDPVPGHENGNLVRDWYQSAYPDDDLGQGIDPAMTFDDAMQAIPLGGGFYDALGVGDSIVRERVFHQLEARTGIPYDTIYNAWLGGKPVPGWHPVQPPELAPHIPEEALHKPFSHRLADEAASSRTASDMLAGSTGPFIAPQQER